MPGDDLDLSEPAREGTSRRRLDEVAHRDVAQFEFLTSHLPFLIAHCDRDLRFRYVNRAYAERFDLPPDEIVGRPIADVIGPDAVRVIAPYVERALGGEQVEYEAWVPFNAIGRRYIRSVYTPEPTRTAG